MTSYSRRTYIHDERDLQPGDLVDIASGTLPYWVAVDHVGDCLEDENDDADCEGDCLAVIFFVATVDGDTPPWHVTRADQIHARLLAEATEADVEADNEAQAAAAYARYAEAEARHAATMGAV